MLSAREISDGDPDRRFRPGDTVLHSGIYEVRHAHGPTYTVVFIVGASFPGCEACHVEYRLLRSAPYILDDEDFGG